MIDFLNPFSGASDETLGRWHEAVARLVPLTLLIGFGLLAGAVWWWRPLGYLAGVACVAVNTAMWVILPLSSREMDSRGWVRGEWMSGRQVGPLTSHQSVIVERDEAEGRF
jgi:hypothetical protein